MGIITTYLLNCSFHGVPFIADNRYHWTERIFWIIMVIMSWLGSVYIMHSSLDQFENNAVSFTVDTSYLNWVSNLPAIIFCEQGNSKAALYANKHFNKSTDYKIIALLQELAFFKGRLTGMVNQCNDNNDCPFIKSDFIKYAKEIRSSCKELFYFCAWNNDQFSCCEQLMPIDTIYGRCYALNSYASRKSPKKIIYMNVSHKVGLDVGRFTIEISNPDIKIFTISRDSVPLYTDDSNTVMDGIAKSPHINEENDIFLGIEEIINDKDVKSTSIKRRGCRFIDESNLNRTKTYSYSACIVECMFKIQVKKCNCNHHLMPSVDKNIICDMEGLICLTRVADDIMVEASRCPCDISCLYTEVKFLGSVAKHSYSHFHNKESTTKLNFILRAPTVRCTRNVVNGYLDLIVSLGGTAGLCVGASVLTAVEIFYYFIVRPLSDHILKRNFKKQKFRIRKTRNKNAVIPFMH